MSTASEEVAAAKARLRGNRIVFSRPAIESPTSPRTRLGNYGQLLRPLSSQLIRAVEALESGNKMHIRSEAAQAYYKLGELFEIEKQLVSIADLQTIHRLIDSLFYPSIDPKSLENARRGFRSFLFRIESSQPSSLSLAEMRRLGLAASSVADLNELVIVRIAHCARKACLALLAVQIELAYAYIEFLSRDAVEISKTHPEVLTDEILQQLKHAYSDLKKRQIRPSNCRAYGQKLHKTLLPLIERSEEIRSRRNRESNNVH